jgi:hypothetical protein
MRPPPTYVEGDPFYITALRPSVADTATPDGGSGSPDDAGISTAPFLNTQNAAQSADAGSGTDGGVAGGSELSPLNTIAGMLERLLIAETRSPLIEASYDEADSLKCMQALGACIINRKNDGKNGWPNTIAGVIKQEGQFKGFSTYPNYGQAQRQRNIQVLMWANQRSKFQAACAVFVDNAKQVASDTIAEEVDDPFQDEGGTYGMRTEGRAGPGSGFRKVGTCGGNDFYTLA